MAHFIIVLMMLLFVASPAFAQSSVGLGAPIWTVVGSLPGSPTNTAQTYIVIDGIAADDCSNGGGTTNVHCAWDVSSSAFIALGGGGSGTGTVDGLTATSGTPGPTTGSVVALAAGTNVTTTRSGDTITIASTGGGHTIADEATPLTAQPTLNFTGSGVSCANNGGASRTDCTITSGGGVVTGISGTSGGTTTGATVTIAGSGLSATTRSGDTVTVATSTDAANLTGTIAAARVGADHIDALTEIAASLKSGSDATLVTGTEGTTNQLAKWDANGDAIATACTEASGALDCSGTISGTTFVGDDSDGSNYVELYDNPSADVTAPSSNNVRLMTSADKRLYMKRSTDAAGQQMLVAGQEFAWVSVADDNADDFGTKLRLANFDNKCTADDTPMTCCDGSGVGVCDGFEIVRGSSISLDDANDEIDLAEVGTYEVILNMTAGFTLGGSSNECMEFVIYQESSGGAEITTQTAAVVGSHTNNATAPKRSGDAQGYAIVDVASAPLSISVYARTCAGTTAGPFPSTNVVGTAMLAEPNPPVMQASILVRRID